MSADNWDTCPKCRAVAAAAKERAVRKAKASYGKVDADEYARRLRDAEQMPDGADGQSLREDYQIGMTMDGGFYVSYRAACQQCDFVHAFTHEQQLAIKATEGVHP